MKKTFKHIAIASILALGLLMSACGGNEVNSNNGNRSNANRAAS